MKCRAVWFAGLTMFAVSPALAEENWTPHLPGVTEGLPAGALPPPGFYFLNTTLVAPFSLYDKNGDTNGLKADVFVDVPMLLWNPGIKVLGADYAVGLAQPVTHVTSSGGALDESSWGSFQTILMPAQLSWHLPADFHVSAGLSVYVPDGTAQKTVISYQGGDYTITKAIGAWTVGVGGYSVNQLEDDKSEYAVIQAGIDAADGNRQTKYAAGPIVGYDFGKASVSAYYNHGFGAKNVLSDDSLWTRLVVPF